MTSMPRTTACLVVTALAAERGGRPVFSGLDFTAAPGTLTRVSGPNGAGKTTLLRILAGLASPAAGRIDWQGRVRVFIGHAQGMNDSLDVIDNLRFAAHLAGTAATDHALRQALSRLDVANLARRRFGSLSQGQKRRSALARLFLAPPEAAWLLDEPFVALDVATQALLARLIDERVGSGGLVLFTSHQEVDFAGATVQEVRL
ncbi:MAG: heme ABC exporter ATP-binding protein CcmA [Casimicrobiaceae bacterium]